MNLKFKHNKYDELAIIEPSKFKKIDTIYKQLAFSYAGRASDLMIQIEKLNNKLKNKDLEMKNKDIAL